jgi:BirA family biotin operon repressor/biotin-[acetyl-CoA-carboxylase] ligase|tara:strand:+ start:55 stop:579 length:525 start_codon:yes stop_codon:yes gene_type:complete
MRLKKYIFKKVESTNNVAVRLIKQGNERGIILTDQQTKGKGQRQNKWISMKGNLFVSVFFEIGKKISLSTIINLNLKIIKKIIHKKINSLTQIRKPNDILINKKKVCGILQETIFKQNKKYLIVGIGINVSRSPKINNYPTTFLNNYSNKKLNRLQLFREFKLLYEKNLHLFGV